MMHDGARSKGGTMPIEIQEKVDRLLDEFMAQVDAFSEDRHLQKGLARSQLPCDMLAAMDKDHLYIVAQLRSENRTSTYIYNPEANWTPQKVKNSAQWEFGFNDIFLIQFPSSIVNEEPKKRLESLRTIAMDHIDSEFIRFSSLISFLRTRPIFGAAPAAGSPNTALLLLPSSDDRTSQSIIQAAQAEGLTIESAQDIRKGRSAIRDMWASINEARVVIADLTGPDPGVMYYLGIAHTVGKDTILISPKGSDYLADIPNTHRIEHEDSDSGGIRLMQDISLKLKGLIRPMEDY